MPRERPPKASDDVFANVVRLFMESPIFQRLSASARDHYGRSLRLAARAEILGAIPVSDMRPSIIQAFLDGLSDKPGAQQLAYTALRSLESWAVVRDVIKVPITTGCKIIGCDGGREPWPDDLVLLAEEHARPDLARMVTLAANTGQRGSDLVRMRWQDIEPFSANNPAPGIRVTQAKTGKRLWVPFTQALIRKLETWEKRPGFLVVKPSGEPFTRPQLSDAWTKERDTNPKLMPLRSPPLSFHGLRATAVLRLRRSGVSKPLIADTVGMSGPMVDHYCKLSEQRDNALAAVNQMETARNNVVSFPGVKT
jgi:integrase